MKRYALSPVLLGSFLMLAIPLPSYAQLASIPELSTPSLLKVPQSLPPTIYNLSDDHPVLPVPPSTDLSTMSVESQTVREYVFQSGVTSEPRSESPNISPISSKVKNTSPAPMVTAITQQSFFPKPMP